MLVRQIKKIYFMTMLIRFRNQRETYFNCQGLLNFLDNLAYEKNPLPFMAILVPDLTFESKIDKYTPDFT